MSGRWQGWDRAVSAALDDDQPARAIDLVCATLPTARRVGPPIRVQPIRWWSSPVSPDT